MGEIDTFKFIKENKIPNISFIIDEEMDIVKSNNLGERFELVIKDQQIIEYRQDPTMIRNVSIFLSLIMVSMIFLFLFGMNMIILNYTYSLIQNNKVKEIAKIREY